MSERRSHTQPRRRMSEAWLVWILASSLALSPAPGYVIVNSVSWSVTSEVGEELDSSSNEEALPALLEDTVSIWKQSYPASMYKEDGEVKSRPGPERSKQVSSPSRMFSYKREGAGEMESPSLPPASTQEQGAKTARFLAHYNSWGFLATQSTQERILGVPFGIVLSVSDGPDDNSTGIPFVCVTPKGSVVSDLMKNPMASLTLPETDFCRKNTIDPDDPRCARLSLTGQMVMVPPEEMDFAKKAMFSRHPGIRKWPRNYEWLFMKMNIKHVCLQNWYGAVSTIETDQYFRVVPSSAWMGSPIK
ncbi:protein CREG2 [Ambystoma mexicanum]|uniref:protein CREG2 n=1 Tax=Ambystoma mexicanum TaxID=8296 RepID=UPI0037E921DB